MCNIDCVETLMVNLKVMAKIGPGFKINTKEKYLELDDTTWVQGVLRWYRGDSRQTTLDKIHISVNSSANHVNKALADFKENNDIPCEMYLNSTAEEFLITIHEIIRNAKVGLENLKDTYIHDETLSSRLEMSISSLERQINNIERNIKIEN
jgi:hypothetical protein